MDVFGPLLYGLLICFQLITRPRHCHGSGINYFGPNRMANVFSVDHFH